MAMSVQIPSDYRSLRRAFIAACEALGADAIARVHSGAASDGKALFLDTVALGSRTATRAVLVIGNDAKATAALIFLLQNFPPPADQRLVLMHALDPAAFAGGDTDPGWAALMLAAVATEDLSRVTELAVLNLAGMDPKPALQTALPKAKITVRAPTL